MNTVISAGFHEPVHDSQTTFRAVLEALSRPGRVQPVALPAETPPGVGVAAYALLLALADHQTPVWLPASEHELAQTLQFHTGCPIVAEPQAAEFALLHAGEGPALCEFAGGDDETPERSATLVIQGGSLHDGPARRLSGPGIASAQSLRCGALDDRFLAQWQANHARFPAGVDAFLTTGDAVVGLPRTTRIEP